MLRRISFVMALLVPSIVIAQHPIIPGHERFYAPQAEPSVEAGLLLLGELNCVSCHQAGTDLQSAVSVKQAPILDAVGTRIRSGYIKEFLNNPQSVKPGTTMPDVLASLNATDKARVIDELTHFLANTGSVNDFTISPLSVNKGRSLFNTVGCLACHDPQEGEQAEISGSIIFPALSGKYTLASLSAFLKNPHQVRPSGRMPSLKLSDDEARDVASYLLRDLKLPDNLAFRYYEGSWDKLPDFSKLQPKLEGTTSGFGVEIGNRKDNFGIVFTGKLVIPKTGEYTIRLGSDDGSRLIIDGKQIVIVDGIHPHQFKSEKAMLTEGEHEMVVEYFDGSAHNTLEVQIEGQGLSRQSIGNLLFTPKPDDVSKSNDVVKVDPDKVQAGRQHFVSLGCADCHQFKEGDKTLASNQQYQGLDQLVGNRGCLKGEASQPHYALSSKQRADIEHAIKYLKEVEYQPETVDVIHRTLVTMNCYTCHQRNELGGVVESRRDFFTTPEKEMGDEARIPPPLGDTGAKLQQAWMKDVLAQGTKVRPYMITRMPKFGEQQIAHLPEMFEEVDEIAAFDHAKDVFSDKKLKVSGRRLAGSKGYSCVKCHVFGNQKASGVQALSMTTMTKRLKYEWFHNYVINPVAMRPLTRMPTAWPNGQVLLPQVLDGSVDQQVYSIWKYLEDGDKASAPQGVGQNLIELYVFDEAVMYRNFIQGAGPRAIGVGYPERANVAFDANQMGIALLWHGSFMDAGRHWTGRGQGFQPPLGDNVLSLGQSPTLAVLESRDATWPSGEIKKQGYQFLGYQLGDKRKPTFIYSLNDVLVKDYPDPESDGGEFPALDRTLQLTSDTEQLNLFLRPVVAGNSLEVDGEGVITVDGEWKLIVQGDVGEAFVRGKELVIPVELVRRTGKFTANIKLRYEW